MPPRVKATAPETAPPPETFFEPTTTGEDLPPDLVRPTGPTEPAGIPEPTVREPTAPAAEPAGRPDATTRDLVNREARVQARINKLTVDLAAAHDELAQIRRTLAVHLGVG